MVNRYVVAASGGQPKVQVLEDLIVSRKTDLGDVVYEDDGSVSLLTNSEFQAFKALDSGPGAAINFNVSFAHNSATMTADGNRVLEVMANAIKYLGASVSLEILVHETGEAHNSGRASLTKRRAVELVGLLKRRYKIENPIELSYSQSFRSLEAPVSRKAPQILPVTLVNNGTF